MKIGTVFFASLLSCIALLTGPGNAAEESGKPNILFIAVDDLRPELGCYGVDEILSPNIDRLAASGVVFDRAYCQLAVCNPSRVSLMTGLRPDSAKVWTLDVRFRHTVPDVVTLPQHFKKHGYYAASFGKIFHNPWPDNVSWSERHEWPKNSRLWSGDAKQRLADFRKQMRADGKSDAAIERMRAPAVEIVDYPESEHIDVGIADQALTAMRRLAKTDEPFFLAAGFVRPHLPFVVPRKYWELYDRGKISLAENNTLPSDAPAFAMNTMYELRDYMDFADAPDPRDGSLSEARQRELMHGYYASVSLIDAQVGRLLDELDALGLAENTIVVLCGDHGWKLGDHNSWCKQTNYEIDARSPLIIRDPHSKAKGQTSRSLVEFVDIYPTLCDLAAVPAAEHLEGVSLRPMLDAPSASVKDAAISQFRRKDGKRDLMGYAMRTDRFRYIEWIDRRTRKAVDFELYDHNNDPAETTNLAKHDEQAARLKELSRQLWSILPTPPALEKVAQKPKRPVMRFRNERQQPVVVYWLPESGDRKKQGVVQPGATMKQNSTLGHRFQVEGAKGQLSKVFTVTKANQTIVLATGKPRPAADGERPNILFLMADDWSYPHAGALGDKTVKTPTFDRMAREGVLFENAFTPAPSCTPSRHAVASGQYHWRLGEGVNLGGSIAADVPVYPDPLAAEGYQTGYSRKGTAPSKHTYRGRDNDPFGARFKNFEAFFSARDPKRPFCFWYGAGEPHRPYDLGEGEQKGIKLDSISVPGFLPDTPAVRSDLADYCARVQRFDSDSARMIAALEKTGELDNTIIVMSGDNGMPFPRAKATLYDFGTRVPLVIRWGKHTKGGIRISDFVNLTDLAPTFLEAAGLPVPEAMSGSSLMPQLLTPESGQVDRARDHVLTGMEQHVYPYPSRAIRTSDFLYIKNFAPANWPTGRVKGEQPSYDFEKTPWPTTPGAFSHNIDPGPSKQWMLQNAESGEHAELYQLAFGPREEEELYDLESDPEQLQNVAADPAYADRLSQLSRQLESGLRSSGDFRYSPAPKN